MTLDYRSFCGAEIAPLIPDLADLRIRVFRSWPYLYDGDLEYEAEYLKNYAATASAVMVGAFAGDTLVGASTGMAMEDHEDGFSDPFSERGPAIDQIYYCAESVLLAPYRGQGAGRRFFDIREARGRALGRAYSAFCGVLRPDDHPARPPDYVPLDGFWRRCGYDKVDGALARFSWKDIGETTESEKRLQFWIKAL